MSWTLGDWEPMYATNAPWHQYRSMSQRCLVPSRGQGQSDAVRVAAVWFNPGDGRWHWSAQGPGGLSVKDPGTIRYPGATWAMVDCDAAILRWGGWELQGSSLPNPEWLEELLAAWDQLARERPCP